MHSIHWTSTEAWCRCSLKHWSWTTGHPEPYVARDWLPVESYSSSLFELQSAVGLMVSGYWDERSFSLSPASFFPLPAFKYRVWQGRYWVGNLPISFGKACMISQVSVLFVLIEYSNILDEPYAAYGLFYRVGLRCENIEKWVREVNISRKNDRVNKL